jgi:hypothetical protein
MATTAASYRAPPLASTLQKLTNGHTIARFIGVRRNVRQLVLARDQYAAPIDRIARYIRNPDILLSGAKCFRDIPVVPRPAQVDIGYQNVHLSACPADCLSQSRRY